MRYDADYYEREALLYYDQSQNDEAVRTIKEQMVLIASAQVMASLAIAASLNR